MVVAYRKKNLKEVYKLQYKILTSFEGRALSVRKVTTNDGKNTPGVDNVVWKGPARKYKAISELRSSVLSAKKYKASNIRRV
jgi:RNA-directed DNA polymerase